MLESQTVIRISRVVVLIIGSILILGFQIILVIGSFLEFRRLIRIIKFYNVGMAVDVMQSATFELNISDSLHSAQTNTAIANEANLAKRTLKFTNCNSVGGSVGLALERPEMHPVGSFILIGQHFLTAQFH